MNEPSDRARDRGLASIPVRRQQSLARQAVLVGPQTPRGQALLDQAVASGASPGLPAAEHRATLVTDAAAWLGG